MATNNRVRTTILLRNDTALNWATKNPVLGKGEFGIEIDTYLVKVGDGIHQYNSLPYIKANAFNVDNNLIKLDDNGNLTLGEFGDSYYVWNASTESYDKVDIDASHPLPENLEARIINGQLIWTEPTTIIDPALLSAKLNKSGDTMTGALVLAGTPTAPLHAATKQYVDTAVANAGHLTRSIVNSLPEAVNANANTIYMVLDSNATGADKYKEYMLINGVMTQIGDTSVDLSNYITKINNATSGNLVGFSADGALVDTGIAANSLNQIATTSTIGLVRSSTAITPNAVQVNELTGAMTITTVSTTKLYVPTGDTLVLDGGES